LINTEALSGSKTAPTHTIKSLDGKSLTLKQELTSRPGSSKFQRLRVKVNAENWTVSSLKTVEIKRVESASHIKYSSAFA
jgi:hypothetical protein